MMQNQPIFPLIVKSLITATLIVLVVITALKLQHLLILSFGAVITGVLIAALADTVGRVVPLPHRARLVVALLLIAAVIVGVAWLFGRQMSMQLAGLIDSLPIIWRTAQENIRTLPGGEEALAALRGSSMMSTADAMQHAATALTLIAGAVSDLLLIVFGAIFIAVNPGLYRRGLVLLAPKRARPATNDALRNAGAALKLWMLGQLISMMLIGLLTGFGLWLVGIPSAAALGLIAGMTEIIPWVGPFLAAVPIIIVALSVSPEAALLAIGVMIAVQQVEGNLIMPYVQKKVVSLPPALTLFGIIAGGVLFGPVGFIFASPLLVVLFVLVKQLYVEEALDTPVDVPGRDDGAD